MIYSNLYQNTEMKDEFEQHENEGAAPALDSKTREYLEELTQEKLMLPPDFSHSARLVQDEIQRIIDAGRGRPAQRYVDVYNERPTKVASKVIVPLKDHPKFNFVGKLLGPRGNTLRRLQEETQTRMAILGRGSMKDRKKEEELRQSLDPKYLHLSDDLHLEISALAPPAEAHARVAYALAEVRKYLMPDSNDEIAAQQRDEMEGEMGYCEDGSMQLVAEMPFTRREPTYYVQVPHVVGSAEDFGVPLGGGRGDSGGRGSGHSNYGHPSGGFGGQERHQPLMHRGEGPVGRGRGGSRGRGSESSQMYANPNHHQELYSDDAYPNNYGNNNKHHSNRGYGSHGSNDYERRTTYSDYKHNDESGRGSWKPRGGTNRFSDRSVPYTRRS